MSKQRRFLPPEFSELERFCPTWIIAGERDRYRFRVGRPLAELEDFYHAVFPRLDELSEYIDRFSVAAMSPQAVHLLRLGQMLMEVSPAVLVYRQPDVPNSISFERFHVISPDDGIGAAD